MNQILTRCQWCNESYTIKNVSDIAFANYVGGMAPQKAFPNHSPEDWDMLISRTCPKCWEDTMGPEPDNDDDNYPIEPDTTEDTTPEPPDHKCLDCNTMISHKRKYCDDCSVPF